MIPITCGVKPSNKFFHPKVAIVFNGCSNIITVNTSYMYISTRQFIAISSPKQLHEDLDEAIIWCCAFDQGKQNIQRRRSRVKIKQLKIQIGCTGYQPTFFALRRSKLSITSAWNKGSRNNSKQRGILINTIGAKTQEKPHVAYPPRRRPLGLVCHAFISSPVGRNECVTNEPQTNPKGRLRGGYMLLY